MHILCIYNTIYLYVYAIYVCVCVCVCACVHTIYVFIWASLVAHLVKNMPAM